MAIIYSKKFLENITLGLVEFQKVLLWENEEERLILQRRNLFLLKSIDFFSLCLGLGICFISLIETEVYVNSIEVSKPVKLISIINGEVVEKEYNTIQLLDLEENDISLSLRAIIVLLDILLIFSIVIRAKVLLKYLKYSLKLDRKANLRSSGLFLKFVGELLFSFFVLMPKVNFKVLLDVRIYVVEYSWDQLMSIFSLGRFYLLWRFWQRITGWNEEESINICNLCFSEGGAVFANKAELKDRPYLMIGFGVAVVVFILGYAVREAEVNFQGVSGLDWDYIWNGMWCIIIIIATVGYGDFRPDTHIGRVFVLITCILGPFLISLMNVMIANVMLFNREETKAYEKIKLMQTYEKLRNSSAVFIQCSYRLHKVLKKRRASINEILGFSDKLVLLEYKFKVSFQEFKLGKQALRNHENFTFDQVLPNLIFGFTYSTGLVLKMSMIIRKVENKIATIESKSQNLDKLADFVLRKNEAILTDLEAFTKRQIFTSFSEKINFLNIVEVLEKTVKDVSKRNNLRQMWKTFIKIDTYNKTTMKMMEIKNRKQVKSGNPQKDLEFDGDFIFERLEVESISEAKSLIHGGFGGFDQLSEHLRHSNLKDTRRDHHRHLLQKIELLKRHQGKGKKTNSPADPLKIVSKGENLKVVEEEPLDIAANLVPCEIEADIDKKVTVFYSDDNSTKKSSINSRLIFDEMNRSPSPEYLTHYSTNKNGKITLITSKKSETNISNKEDESAPNNTNGNGLYKVQKQSFTIKTKNNNFFGEA